MTNLLTTEDIATGCASPFNQGAFTASILPKLEAFRISELFNKSHIIPAATYPRVYVTSDIHADFRKFVQMVRDMGLVRITKDPYTDEIYDPEMISEVEWVGGRGVFLAIVGDLVDGVRSERSPPVDDPRGSFELLLHCFIHNIRMKALAAGSEVRFTIGNHDHATVLYKEPFNWDQLYYKYVHSTAKAYFGDFNNNGKYDTRREVLTPFYANCPFYFLSIENGEAKEVALLHAGLDTIAGTNMTAQLVTIQQAIAAGQDFKIVYNQAYRLVDGTTFIGANPNTPLWVRLHSETRDGESCGRLEGENFPYSMLAIGHCPTPMINNGQNKRFAKLMLENEAYHRCDRFDTAVDPWLADKTIPGCVMLDCDGAQHDQYPKLAYVDSASSQAFRSGPANSEHNNQLRRVQVLFLEHKGDAAARPFYNIVERQTLGGGVVSDIISVWPRPGAPQAVGGRRRRRTIIRRRSIRRSTRRSTRRRRV